MSQKVMRMVLHFCTFANLTFRFFDVWKKLESEILYIIYYIIYNFVI